ncbi:MAG: helix-turn-helix transcriptional regulator [Oscillospiraceae bacterium]|nr:helix-turn-helix transcriptional regulator [Oscillospiraceae bacterium]
MDLKLTVIAGVNRDKFIMKHFIGSDDIFALVKSGSFYVENNEKKFTVNANEGMLFRKNILYNRHVIRPVRMFLFRYTGETHLFNSDHVLFKDQNRISSTIALLEHFDSKFHENNFKYKRHLFEDIVLQYLAENNETSAATDNLIEKSITEIKANFHKNKSIAEFAEESGLSYIQFFRRFKTVTGFSPSDYIAALRIEKAKDLLINTTLKINEISSVCGFENEYYFSNFFKKYTKLSPSAFRSSLL